MTKLLLRIYDYLTGHRITAVVLLAVMLAAGVLLALQLHYEENIARFLPIDKGNEKQAAVYNALGDQGQITVVFRPAEQAGDEEVMDAIDAFAEQFARIRPDIALQARAEALRGGDEGAIAREIDLLRYQVREIEEAALDPESDGDALRDEYTAATNAARILELGSGHL